MHLQSWHAENKRHQCVSPCVERPLKGIEAIDFFFWYPVHIGPFNLQLKHFLLFKTEIIFIKQQENLNAWVVKEKKKYFTAKCIHNKRMLNVL